jgi:hypothetical protein
VWPRGSPPLITTDVMGSHSSTVARATAPDVLIVARRHAP